MGLHHSPRVVTSGLALAIDAADINSYPGAGFTAVDLTGNLNGNFLGGTSVITSDVGGSKVFGFDGVNDTIKFGQGIDLFPIPQITLEVAYRGLGTTPTTGTTPGLFGFTYGIRCFISSANLRSGFDNGTGMTFISSNVETNDEQWHVTTITNDGSTGTIFLDGIQVAQGDQTWSGTTRWPTDNLNLGRDNNNVNYYFTGEIAYFRIYRRALTLEEHQQNFNATKTRFGL